MRNEVHYLGRGLMRTYSQCSQGQLKIELRPNIFHKLLSTATQETRMDILYGKQVIAVYNYRPDCTYSFSDIPVTITCLYAYIFEQEENPNLRILQPDNAETNLPKLVSKWYQLEDTLPLFVFFFIRPYNAIDFGHTIGVDIEVFYRWDEMTLPQGANIKILHLAMYQERTPPMRPFIPLNHSGTWSCLGEILLDTNQQSKNQLEFTVNASEFLNDCPEGDLNEQLKSGLAIRSATVYSTVPARNLTGLQVRLNNQQLIIELGQFLDFNQDYCGKHVQAFYRWRGRVIELGIRTSTVD
ncbi:hypothetical protein BVRB_5g114960 [Beta vulgaris subsp. vulgaris]|nr:hypothetical protein BVRB_5g114960 [Beta vulgaris subsp. vulgaris]